MIDDNDEDFEQQVEAVATVMMEEFQASVAPMALTDREAFLFGAYSRLVAVGMRSMYDNLLDAIDDEIDAIDDVGDADEPRELKLFKVENGATYWVAAFNADDAIELVRKFDAEACGDIEANALAERATVAHLPEEAARKISFEGHGNIWNEFRCAEKPSVLGCSEW